MGQKRFTTYKASVNSFPLGEQHIGVFKPGRYNGFDSMTTEDNITITLAHTGVIKKTTNQDTQVSLFGVVVMPTGIIIHEEGAITLTMPNDTAPTIGQPQTRKFAVVCEHNYQQVKGGANANYILIAGNLGTTVPALTNPKSQVLLGVITKDYTNNTLTYNKQVNNILGDMSNLELFKLIEPYLPNQELPDITETVLGIVKANKPRTIITPSFDIADSNSLPDWTTIPYVENPNQGVGHNLKDHLVQARHVRIATGTGYTDVYVEKTGSGESWEWGSSNLLSANIMNDADKGPPIYGLLEIKGVSIAGPGTGKVRRFQLGEESSRVQACQLRLTLQNNIMLTGTGSGGTGSATEFITASKSLVGISPVYEYGQVITISASGDWTVTSDNPAVTAFPTNGKAGDTLVTINVDGNTGYIEGTLTFSLTGTTKEVNVVAYKNNSF